MNGLQKKDLLIRLTTEFGYPMQGAEIIIPDILALQPSLKTLFEQWWQTGIVPNIEIEGYTIERLKAEQGMNVIAAFLTLDWLIQEPADAMVSLRSGHDKIILGEP